MTIVSRFKRISAAACILGGIAALSAAQAQSPPQLVTNGPQVSAGDNTGSAAAQHNVSDSNRYERMIHGNVAYRQQRMRQECGSIGDPTLHEDCIASFR